jgi:hypothetical protein
LLSFLSKRCKDKIVPEITKTFFEKTITFIKTEKTMRHIQLLSLLTLLVLNFYACAPDTGPDEMPDARLLCETREGEMGIPESEVYTIIDDQKIKIANISACDSIPREQYVDYDIPDSALAAVGGWYAGAGDYLYIVREADQLAYYQGWQDEMQEDEGFHYTRIGTYQSGGFELQLPPKREELVGTYTASKETGSHILFIGMHGDTLIGEHFEMDGILPPLNQLNVLMTGMAPRDSVTLNLVDQSFRFSSKMGDGMFKRSNGGIEVSLNLKDGQQINLQKALSKDYSLPAE